MSVHYKFKSALEYDTVTFDGLHISVRDLKKAILHQKRIGKNTDFDLQITNAQTKEVYVDDATLIPKNTSLIVARVPLTAQQKKAWDRAESSQPLPGLPKVVDAVSDGQDPGVNKLAKAVDLSSLDASEEDKIQAMMTQSTQDYNPSNYMKIRGANQMGEVPPNYRCYKCHQPGHWIKNCPLGTNMEPIEIKKSTGIPRSFMVPVEGPTVPGAMMTPTGQFAVPAIDHQAYKEGKKEKPPFQHDPEPVVQKPEIPEDLQCSVCKDLLTDAVMIPCCGNSFCDECIRTVLLESEDHECPDCKEKDVSPDTLIPNRFLRTAVSNFKNATGYNKMASNLRPLPQHRPSSNLLPIKPAAAAPPPAITSVPPEPVGQAVPVIGASQPSQNQSSSDFTTPVASSHETGRETPVTQTMTSSSTLIHVQTCQATSTIPVLGAPKQVSAGTLEHQRPRPVREPVIHLETAPPLGRPEHGTQRTTASAPVESRVRKSQPKTTTAPVVPLEGQKGHARDATAGQSLKSDVSGMSLPASSTPSLIMQPSSSSQHPVLEQVQPVLAGASSYPPGHRRSIEERPGTPTIDEHTMDTPTHPVSGTLPDTSIPPPNFPPGEEQVQTTTEQQQPVTSYSHIQTLGSRTHRIPTVYRPDHPFQLPHRLGGQTLEHLPPRHLTVPPSDHNRNFHPRATVINQSTPAGFGPRGPPSFEHPPAVFHHESGSSRGPHYDTERDGTSAGRGYRGYNRGRGRALHGYRGGHLHHQPPPPGLGRSVHNGNQTGTIEDPLEAFQRMLKEKDDRDRKLKRTRRPSRSRSRSYTPRSRSASTRSYTRSRSHSRTPRSPRSRTPRSLTPRSRTPRKRSRTRTRSRSRSRSFTISRSRSRSFSRSPTPRIHSPREREFSPRRRGSSRYRTPTRSPPRYQRPFKDVRSDYEATPFYEAEYQYGTSGNRARGGRFGQRKDYNKDYYDQNYSRYNSENRFHEAVPSREVHHRVEPLAAVPPALPRFSTQSNYRRYDHYTDVAPPGTETDLPPLLSYDKSQGRYDRGYERQSGYENRQQPDEFLTPPGVEHRRVEPLGYISSARERDNSTNRDRDIIPTGVREREVIGPSSSVTRDRDLMPPGVRDRDREFVVRDRDGGWEGRNRDNDITPVRETRETVRIVREQEPSDRIRDKDRENIDRERPRDRNYYELDHRRTYESKTFNYNSPDGKRKRQSSSPIRRGGSRERYSSAERHHRHSGTHGNRRRNLQREGGKENRHSLQQPVEALDVTREREERDRDTRERVLVEVRKEPSVERDRSKKEDKIRKEEDKDKKTKEKKKKKKDREVDGDKTKKKKRKEKREVKKDMQESGKDQERIKSNAVKTDKISHKNESGAQEVSEQSESHTPEKPCPVTSMSLTMVEDKPKASPITTVITDKVKGQMLRSFETTSTENVIDDLYADIDDARIDDTVMANYGKAIPNVKVLSENVEDSAEIANIGVDKEIKGIEGQDDKIMEKETDISVKEELETDSSKIDPSFDAEQLSETKANVVLAPIPEPSKWELDEEIPSQSYEDKNSDDKVSSLGSSEKPGKIVTSEVLKRAENAIFQKAINAIRPVETSKKISVERKIYTSADKEKRIGGSESNTLEAAEEKRKIIEKDTREARKTANSIQITIPISGHAERSVEVSASQSATSGVKTKTKLDRSKFSNTGPWGEGIESLSPQRVSAKERLGARVDSESNKNKEDVRESRHEIISQSNRSDKDDRRRKLLRNRSRSDSREKERTLKHSSRKGLKSAVERRRSVSKSRSRSPHFKLQNSERVRDMKDIPRYPDINDRRYDIAVDIRDRKHIDPVDIRRKYGDIDSRSRRERDNREMRYVESERERRYLESSAKKIDGRDQRDRRNVTPDKRRERSLSRDRRNEKLKPKDDKDREKSVDKSKGKHKTKRKGKRSGSESRSRKKSLSDKESKRKKRDKKHKKEKGKKHKKVEKDDKKEGVENGQEKEIVKDVDPLASKDFKANPSNDGEINKTEEGHKTAHSVSASKADVSVEPSKDKTRKGPRRNPRLASDRKKSTLDEASFEPDYDASSSVESELEDTVEIEKKVEADKKTVPSSTPVDSPGKKRERSDSVEEPVVNSEKKRQKPEKDVDEIKKPGKSTSSKSNKKRGRSASSSKDDSSDDESSDDSSSSASSSSSEEDSSDDSSVKRRRKKKSRRRRHKRSKKASRHAETSSESDSDSESDDGSSSESDEGRGKKSQSRSKKRHHHNRAKVNKKKKKSKHR